MHLTLINFFKKSMPGHIFKGKKRFVREVKFQHMKKKIEEFELQERNMALLRKPYLTLEQSKGHAAELGKTAQKMKFWYDNRIKPPLKPHVKIEDRLSHIRHTVPWE